MRWSAAAVGVCLLVAACAPSAESGTTQDGSSTSSSAPATTVLSDQIPTTEAPTNPSRTDAPTTSSAPFPTGLPDGWDPFVVLPFKGSNQIRAVGEVGGRLVVAGDDSTIVLDPDGSWVSAPASPLHARLDRGSLRAYPADDSIALLVGEFGAGPAAMFDVESLTWRELPAGPVSGYLLGAAWVGRELVVVAGASRNSLRAGEAAALDIETGTWRELPDPPFPVSVGGITSHEGTVIVLGTHQDGNNQIRGDRQPRVAVLDMSTLEWVEVPGPQIDGQAATVMHVDGGFVAWNYGLESAIADSDGMWRNGPDLPVQPSECYPGGTRIESGVLAIHCGQLAVFDVLTEQWIHIPTLSGISSRFWDLFAVLDNYVIAFDTTSTGETGLYRFELRSIS